ncbi:MAG: cofactor-independent phosphoglycerate mutase [Ruminococcaceae bacterium]|nr:cofactor-independent phosphoglycerate mutase [Oscillospiraceae bacterium]
MLNKTRYAIIVPDGMADEPIEAFNNKTVMEYADKPCMNMLASLGKIGTVSNVPDGMVPESDTANMSILSFDPKIYSKGRSPLEALSMGLTMTPDDTAIRCNLVSLSEDEDYNNKTMLDHSGGDITTAEADILIKALNDKLAYDGLEFHTGIDYRHCLMIRNGYDKYNFARPHDIIGKNISEYLPCGQYGDFFYDLMRKSYDILENHPLNIERAANGKLKANSIWLWSPGKKPQMPNFCEKWALDSAVVIAAVDLIKGIGKCAGMTVPKVEGANGTPYTDFESKGNAACKAFDDGAQLVYVHIEAPDESGHKGDANLKVWTVEQIDKHIVAKIYEKLKAIGDPFKIMVLPDHPTPCSIRTHSISPVPYLIYSSEDKDIRASVSFDEISAARSGNYVKEGHTLLNGFIDKK